VDKLVEGADPQAAGLAYANELLAARARRAPHPRHRNGRQGLAQAELDAGADTAKKSRGLFSPLKIIECVQAAWPFDEGLKERALFWNA
jgi:3-hydroxyacyl-CoA dehydrogenase